MEFLPRTEGLGPADTMAAVLIPLLVLIQVFAGLAAWRRMAHGEHLTTGEALADIAPALVLIALLAAQPFLVAHPDAPITLAVAYVVVLAFYAAVGYGSLSRTLFHLPGRHGRHFR